MPRPEPKDPLPSPETYESLTPDVVTSIKALMNCEADEHQQKIAMDWIISMLCRTYENAYYKQDTDTAFALGKQFVGQQIVNIHKLDSKSFFKPKRTTP